MATETVEEATAYYDEVNARLDAALNETPRNPEKISSLRSTLRDARINLGRVRLEANAASESRAQAAADAENSTSLPQADSGQKTALSDDEIKGNAALRSEPQTTVNQRNQLTPKSDQISGLQPKKKNTSEDVGETFDENGVPTNQQTLTDPNTPHYDHYDVNGVAIPSVDSTNAVITDQTNKKVEDVKPKNKVKPNVSPNILHNYASYTYNLSLHALSGEDYTKMINDPVGYVPTKVLIASAGRRSGDDLEYGSGVNMQRSAIFNEDFFFDKLEMETVIGLNSQARNSNVVNLSFTIIEPYGMTLLNRLLKLGDEIEVKGNYLAIPYLLQIDFFGYGDDGIPVKINQITKRIPIRIATLGMKVSTKGAEYAIQAYPFNHQAFSETAGTVPIKLEVSASTIADFFVALVKDGQSGEADATSSEKIKDYTNKKEGIRVASASLQAAIRENESKLAEANKTDSTVKLSPAERKELIANTKAYEETLVKISSADPTSATVQSFTGAINAWKQQLVDDKQIQYADTILFEIHKDIAEATFPDKDNISKDSTLFTKNRDEQKGVKTNAGYTAKPVSQMSINQGTSILEVIGLAIKNSSFIYNQILDPTRAQITKPKLKEFLEKPLQWFKVIPRIELGKYDELRNEFSKKTIYQIVPFEVANTKSEDAPQGGPKEYIKDYQYIFTGQNYDILNFDLKFDTLYFSAKTAIPANQESVRQAANETGTQSAASDKQNELLNASEINEIIENKAKGIVSLRHRTVIVGQIPGNELGKGSTTEAIKRLNKNILTNPSGDMISVQLKIIGDPDFIKQDDFFFGPGMVHAEQKHKTPNGSIITDAREIFVNLTFNTPGDYDDTTGLARPNSGLYSVNSFSGIYRVLTVKNYFAQGKFEQTLDLVRYPNQEVQGIESQATEDTEVTRTDNNIVETTNASDNRVELSAENKPNSSSPVIVAASPVTPSNLDVPAALSDPSQSTAAKLLAADGISSTPSIDVDANNGKIGVVQTNAVSAEDMAGTNPYAGLANKPATPMYDSTADGSLSPVAETTVPAQYRVVPVEITTYQPASANNNPALAELKIDSLRNEITSNATRISELNTIVNTARIDSRQWAAAKIELDIILKSQRKLGQELINTTSGRQ